MAEDSPLNPDGNLTEHEYEWTAAPQAPDGLIGHPSDPAPVTVSGGTLVVRAGVRALLRGFPYWSGSSPTVFSPSLSGPTRTDLLVLRLDRPAGYTVRARLRTGTAGNPAPAAVVGEGEADVYEMPLGEAVIGGGSIQQWTPRAWFIGPDGQILCTSSTRPPHSPGRRIRETDTGRSLESTGSAWASVLDDSGWVNLTPAPGWGVNTLRIRRMSGIAYLHVDVDRTGGGLAANTTSRITTVPAAYRLGSGLMFAAAVVHVGKIGRVSVAANGDVNLSNHEGVSSGQYVVSSADWPIG